MAFAATARGSIRVTTHLWVNWLRVAVDHALSARHARAEASQQHGSDVSSWISKEFEASLVAIAASAHALDALYGSTVVPQSLRAQWHSKGTKRHGKIREALKQVFNTGKVNTAWVAEFDWLFNLRDAAAHAEEEPKIPVSHPLGTNTAPEHIDYSTESADRAVTFALSVFRWCADNPRPNVPESAAWGTAHQATLTELEDRWNSG